MKFNYTCKNHRLIVEIEAGTARDAFKQLAEGQEVFDEAKCGSCKSDDLCYRVRTVEGNDYFEVFCRACTAKLSYGQHKVGGGLFPKRKNESGEYDRLAKGWKKWVRESEESTSSQA